MNFKKVNGITIHYNYIACSAGKMTFVFINSLGTDFRIWDEVVEKMRDYGNILLFDKRGHGLSEVPESTKGLGDYMNDVLALCKHLLIKKFTVIGLSVGGMIAQLIAYHYPEKIEKLILCDTRHKIGNEETWNQRIAAVEEQGLSFISQGVMQRWFSESFMINEMEKVTGYKNMLERCSASGYIQTCKAIRDADLTEIAKQIKTDTLCIAGSEDKSTTPQEVQNLSDLIESAQFKLIEGSGHIPCVDNPEALSKLIIDFIKG